MSKYDLTGDVYASCKDGSNAENDEFYAPAINTGGSTEGLLDADENEAGSDKQCKVEKITRPTNLKIPALAYVRICGNECVVKK